MGAKVRDICLKLLITRLLNFGENSEMLMRKANENTVVMVLEFTWCSQVGCEPGKSALPAPGSLASQGKDAL